ncbi:MAG: hypothetical protein JO112_14525 [Planctomycetes bacterium]|nr:hypothetical protein [Planctomycetota bacterium]
MTSEALHLMNDPVWPWSLAYGLPALAVVALVLVGLTVWTYLGVSATSWRRLAAMLGLRLTALVLILLMALRPSLASRDNPHEPYTLLIVPDLSESMTIQDEFDGQSRWDNLRRQLQAAGPILQRLQEQQNVTISWFGFAEDVRPFDPNNQDVKPDGKRTDFGRMLHSLYESHGQDRHLRGLLILSDGADNGTRYPALTEAAKWRNLPCPIFTFGVGKETTGEGQSDIAFAPDGIHVDPAPVPIKSKMTVTGILNAPGFENSRVTVHLFLDDQEVPAWKESDGESQARFGNFFDLPKTTGNEVRLVTNAPEMVPANPEMKVTLRVDPLPKELSTLNNQIETFVTVTKEGISVLVVDRPRFPEPQRLCDALSSDPRVRLYVAWCRSDQPGPDQPDLFQFDKQHYDVIILGDVSSQRLTAGNPQALTQIQDQVRKGAGLLMMGGYQAFGNDDWQKTPLADLLPVRLNVPGQVDEEVQMEPTESGLQHFVMQLSDLPSANGALWAKLPPLNGMTHLGEVKPEATLLAVRAGGTREPMLVGQQYGEGRVLAFAGDTTWRWERLGQPKSPEGVQLHHRFWKQVVFWLAHQDRNQGTVWIKPDKRRVPSGGEVGFSVGLRGKGGVDLKDGKFEVTVVGPTKAESPVPVAQEKDGQRGTFWKTDAPGEYQFKIHGQGKDSDGKDVRGDASARFVVYQDDAEMVRRAADHDFLIKLANAGGGKYHEAHDLAGFLQELEKQPLAQGNQKVHLWPDWRRSTYSGFRVGLLFLFVAVVSLEWLLRRRWGMV